MEKQEIIRKLKAFVLRRPGFDLCNYASMSDYRCDYRRTLKDRDDALKLLDYINWHDVSIPASALLNALNSGGRLELKNGELEYCAGQYYPIEYRGAVVRLCASVIRSCLWKEGEDFKTTMYREFDKRFANRVWF